MREITFDSIESLVSVTTLDADMLKCVFTCPQSGKDFEARANVLQANQGNLSTGIKNTIQQNVSRSLVRTAMQFCASIFGGGMTGRIARDVTAQAAHSVAKKRVYTKAEKERAIVVAFEQVKSQFRYDEELGTFVAAVEKTGTDKAAVAAS